MENFFFLKLSKFMNKLNKRKYIFIYKVSNFVNILDVIF